MKNHLSFVRLSVAISMVMLINAATNAQTLLIENFNYVSGTTLTSNGWNAHSGAGTNPVTVGSLGLVFQSYPSSNIGLAALLANDGEDVNRTFTSITSGKVFCAFLLKVNSIANDYFLHFSNSGLSSNRGRISIKGTGNSFNLGLSKGAEASTLTTGSPYLTGVTYLLVLKYSIVEGASNDNVSLHIITTSIPATEPVTPSIGPLSDPGQTDLTNISSIALRQYSSSQNILIDGIRVAQKWEDVIGTNTGIEEKSEENNPVLFPLPVASDLIISNIRSVNAIEIFDFTGRKILTINTMAMDRIKIPVSHLLKGIYLVRFIKADSTIIRKFIKS
jgi:hypothetical protein